MKKILSIAILFMVAGAVAFASSTIDAKANDSESVITSMSNDEYVDSVEAQNAQGTQTRSFTVYGRRQANGKYWYFVKTSTREFGIQYADNNRYKPFYVNINGERWYFASKELDRNSGKTDQW